jgi:acetyl-CoA decarbonylase/synthase complex subunit gamma
MGLTGLQIYKLLPQTNCKECGYPTCLAFAMKLSAQKEDLAKCPYASEEAKSALGSASAPPIKLVTIGEGEGKIVIGEETVLFRHDKTFFHHPAIGEILNDEMSDDELNQRLQFLLSQDFERAGEILKIDIVGIQSRSGNSSRYQQCIEIVKSNWKRPIALIAEEAEIVKTGMKLLAGNKPLIIAPSDANRVSQFAQIAREYHSPLMICGDDTIEGTLKLAESAKNAGAEDIILCPGDGSLSQVLAQHTLLRRLALERLDHRAGFPSGIILRGELVPLLAPLAVCKYPAIILMENPPTEIFISLMTLRQNIYTDPQKPLQVEGKIYPIGEPNEDSPIIVTTNFSLTYFMVSSEIDASGVPAHLAIVEAEGMSVLTAWSAGKFSPQIIAKALKNMHISDLVKHRKVIIPGYVSSLKGELEEEMPGWEVLVGPQEAADIGDYFKNVWMEN